MKRLYRPMGEEGGTLVEFALVFPILMLLLLGLVEAGGMAWTHEALTYAVQESARCAVVRPDLCGTPAATQAFAVQRVSPLTWLAIPAGAFTVSSQTCGTQVSASVAYKFLSVPGSSSPLLGGAPTLTAQACRT